MTLLYPLDGNGKRTRIATAGALPATGHAGGMDYTYTDRGNRLIHTGSTRLTYDQEGQLANNGGTPYTFDGMHRLTGYGASTFSYDGAGNRLLATRSGTTSRYVHDASGNLLVEKDANGNILKYFIYGKGLLAWVDAATNAVYCCHFDGNANTVAVTDSNQAVVDQYSYSPFGIMLNRIEAHTQPFTFVGQFGVFDEGDNIYYMRARYYDATVGRFISEDPAGFDGGDVNLYSYVQNSPAMSIDPSGLCQTAVLGTTIAIGAGAGTWAGPSTGALMAAGVVGAAGAMVLMVPSSIAQDSCPPCRFADGTIVPIGTISYRWDIVPADQSQHGIYGDHLNLYKANQNPINCRCFWQPIGAAPPPPEPEWIPIQPFAN